MSELETTIKKQESYIEQLENTIKDMQHQISNLNDIIRVLQKGRFTPSSEKTTAEELEGQVSFFNEAEFSSDIDSTEDITVKEHTRKGKKSKRIAYIGELPVREVICELSEEEKQCPQCGTALKTICKETVREELNFIPAKIERVVYIREVAECPKCKNTETPYFKKAETPKSLLNHSLASPSIVSEVMVQKYANSLPLYRQEKIWENLGITLNRTTMANWIIRCSEEYLSPIVEALRKNILSQDICQCDETPIQVLKEENRKATTKSYMWVFRTGETSDKPSIIYDYHPSRSGDNAAEFLKTFQGYVVTDGFSGYNKLKGITHCGCWAHLRRKYKEATPEKKSDNRKMTAAEIGAAYCDKLFHIEKQLKDLTSEERYKERLKQEKPVLEAYWSWLKTINPLKGSKLQKAVIYSRNQKQALENYLLDGRLPISNNASENAIRPFCIGRKNWLFADTPKGAKASAAVYTLIETAKANNLNVKKYLETLLTEMSNIGRKFEVQPELLEPLMPWSNDMKTKCQS